MNFQTKTKPEPTIGYAKRVFSHYFRMIAQTAGVHWNGENTSEIESAVEDMEEQLQLLHSRIEQLEREGEERDRRLRVIEAVLDSRGER